MFVVVLDDEEPISESQACQKLMTGRPENRFVSQKMSKVNTVLLNEGLMVIQTYVCHQFL